MSRSLAVGAAVLLLLAPLPALASTPSPAEAAHGGRFSVLTYNIAGLPEIGTDENPSVNTPIIGERIGAYDIVHVQEDFNHHAALYEADDHPHRTPTSGGVPFGDGLNTLSTYPYSDFERVRWDECNGVDCLTPKGFTFSRIRLAEGVYLDLYNLHTNAGVTSADLAARRSNITQLSEYIQRNSRDNAVVVMGDTNTRYTRAEDNIRELVDANGLTDAWVATERAGRRPAAGDPALVCDPDALVDDCEVVDKVLFRGNVFIDLELTGYANDHADFLDGAGEMLSDHFPHTAEFSWTTDDAVQMSDPTGGPHGTPFTDVARIAAGARPTALTLRAGSRIDAVGMRYADGTRTAHGGTGGTAAELSLETGENLASVTLSTGKKNGHTRVFSAEFRTDRGRTLAVGTPTTDTVTYTAPVGWRIAGFHGRSGDEVDKLGLIYTPIA
ncbi:jacalin-like lectin [Nocardiopsis rhodophaea]|uniref:Jacalin-like lectin n=1 Tax=Nocardiopsis rhodophaea TaxID=280238 RepID=A0ABP5E2V5_9ACTN